MSQISLVEFQTSKLKPDTFTFSAVQNVNTSFTWLDLFRQQPWTLVHVQLLHHRLRRGKFGMETQKMTSQTVKCDGKQTSNLVTSNFVAKRLQTKGNSNSVKTSLEQVSIRHESFHPQHHLEFWLPRVDRNGVDSKIVLKI